MEHHVREIQNRLLLASRGKWKARFNDDDATITISASDKYVAQLGYDGLSATITENRMNDAAFIIHAKEDIAYLLAVLKKSSC